MSLGRLDQILYPFYEKEIAERSLDMDQASDLIDALWLKFASIIQGYQNVTIGGYDAQGKSAINDITFLCMRASRKLQKDQPALSLRCNSQMPECYWIEAQAMIVQGGGLPALFNDDVIIRAKVKLGVAKEDAWNYGLVGCVEPSICGKEYSNTEELRINWSKVIELMLNNGACMTTGTHIGLANPKSLDSIKSFQEFYDWYMEELIYFTRKGMDACNMLDSTYSKFFPSPMLSLTMDGCIKNAKDASAIGKQTGAPIKQDKIIRISWSKFSSGLKNWKRLKNKWKPTESLAGPIRTVG
jgi:formate C-acetyltransferase